MRTNASRNHMVMSRYESGSARLYLPRTIGESLDAGATPASLYTSSHIYEGFDMFVIVCNPTEEAPHFGYGPFETRAEAEAWTQESALYNIRLGNQPCTNEHDILEIFTAQPDGGIG